MNPDHSRVSTSCRSSRTLRRRPSLGTHGVLAGAAALILTASNPLPAQGATYRVSTSTSGAQANQRCMAPSMSHDGRVVVFVSRADDLVPNDGNGKQDVFVKDLVTGAVRRASVSTTGAEANGDSWQPVVSADGRVVAFESSASNLVAGDRNGHTDVFVHDLATAVTTRVNVASNGAEADAYGNFATLSGDGSLVAFLSPATNLVAGDTNGRQDAFVHDRRTGRTTRESVSTSGAQANDDQYDPVLSADGRCLAFGSTSTNLVANDTNDRQDVFLRDLAAGTTVRITGLGGTEPDDRSAAPALSADGRFVAFESDAANLVANDGNGCTDVFVLDRVAGTLASVSVGPAALQANGPSRAPAIAADGSYVAFTSDATNLASRTSGFTDVFVHDRAAGATVLASQSSDGRVAGDTSYARIALSGDGRYVAFQTAASNLVPNDVNQVDDVLVHETLHHLSTQDQARVGQPLRLDVRSPLDAGKTYVVLAALNTQFGIPLGARLLALDADPLLLLSLSVPAVFQNFAGALDAQGRAQARFAIPNEPALAGFFFCTSYLVLDPSWHSPFRGIGNSLSFQVAR